MYQKAFSRTGLYAVIDHLYPLPLTPDSYIVSAHTARVQNILV
jgi:hypothetical protein